MRQILTRRFALALGLPVLLAATWWFVAVRGGSAGGGTESQPHAVSYTASVVTVQADANWTVKNGLTIGSARLAMDDGRTLFLAESTPAEISCTDRTTPNACVLLAEMLGDAPVWFALTPAKGDDPTTRLALPPIADMLKNGDEAVLANGWVVPLATPTKRVCDTSTSSLRDFIDRFGQNMDVSLNLATDEIDTVRCTAD
jgi:hypothetical protein